MSIQISKLQKPRTRKVGVVIPVYGETEQVCRVLSRFGRSAVNEICLVVDVPLKQEMEKVREAAKSTGIAVHIIKNRDRMGVGYAIRQGIKCLLEIECAIAVIIAGNGKDDPSEIERLTTPIIKGECDYVQGSRYLPGGRKGGMPLTRTVFNRVYPFIWTFLTNRKCTDVTNGYRCYRLDLLSDPRIDLNQEWLNGYSLEYYLHYKVLALGYRVKEAPVSKTYPFGNRGGYSKIQPLKDWWPILSPLFLLFFGVRR